MHEELSSINLRFILLGTILQVQFRIFQILLLLLKIALLLIQILQRRVHTAWRTTQK